MRHKTITDKIANVSRLLLLLSVFSVVGCLYALVTPPFEASDETFHYPVVRYIAQGKGLPVQQVGVKQAWDQEGSQPPLYYLLSAALTSWIDTSDYENVAAINPFARTGIPGTPQNANFARYAAVVARDGFIWRGTILAMMLIRFISLILSVGTLTCTYLLALQLFKQHHLTALLATAIVAFNPMFLFISASVNNDSLIWFLASLVLYWVAKIIGTNFGIRFRELLLLGLVLAAAALTKISGLVLLPIAGLAFCIKAWQAKRWSRLIWQGMVLSVCVASLAGWWYLRNWQLYGEPLGLATMVAIAGPRPSGFSIWDLLTEWQSFLFSYWGVFGVFSVLAPTWVYWLYSLVAFVGILGLLKNIKAVWSLTFLLLILFVGFTFASLVRWSLSTMASQGRLLFTAQPILAASIAYGLLSWLPKNFHRQMVGACVGVLGFVALAIAANNIAPAYLPLAPLKISQLPSNFKSIHAKLTPEVELMGYQLESPNRLTTDDELVITLYWQSTVPMTPDYNLFLHLLGQQQQLVGNVDTWLGGGLRPTSLWRVGEIYPDRYVISIDAQAQTPTKLMLDLAVWRKELTERLGQPLMLEVGLLDSSRANQKAPRSDAASTLEGGITLLGFDLPADLSTAHPFIITLYWQTSTMLSTDYTVFVHFFDLRDNLIAQADAPPLNGDWLTTMWQPNRTVLDPHQVVLPRGQYIVRVGLYDPKTLERLAAFKLDGSEWLNSAIELTTISVK